MSASFPSGQIEGRVSDRSILVDGKAHLLKDLRAVRFAPRPAVVLSDGTEVVGEATGLESVPIDMGGPSITVDLRKAERIELAVPPVAPTSLKAIVAVRSGNVEVTSIERIFEFGESDGTSDLTGPGGPGRLSPIRPPAMSHDQEEIKLPGPVTDVTAGGGGRVLLLTIKSLKKLAIFDVNSAKVTRILSLPSEDSLVAAGAEKFLIVSPSAGIIQRWDLATLERERTASVPFAGSIISVAMGSRSNGPVMVFVSTLENNNISSGRFAFFDPISLRLLADFRQEHYFMKNRQNVAQQSEKSGLIFTPHFSQGEQQVQLRASPGGELFTAWSTQHSPAGLLTFRWKTRKTLEFRYDHTDVLYNVPSLGGLSLYTGSAGILNEEQKPVIRDLPKERRYLPSTAPNYFLGFEGNRASLYATGSSSPLILIGDFKELGTGVDPRQPYNQRDFIWDKRIQFIAEANLLVTVPAESNQITLRRVNALDLLKRSPVDYLFVESIPPREAAKGRKFEYQINARSRRGGVKYELSGGPEGMAVSREGMLTWNVPVEIDEEEVTPIITIKDNSGSEIFHTFSMTIR